MTRTRNEGGRYSAKHASDWYASIESEWIAQIEAEWAARQADTDAYYPESDGDLVPWDRAA